ncbi:MAG: helix-turn-helix domain-containing protein [Candidatus Dormibacteraceae bacterium]
MGRMVRIDGDRLRFELARRGLDQAGLARRAQLRPETISRAVTGHPVSHSTLSAIAKVLLEVSPKQGVDLILASPGNAKAPE